MEQNKVMTFKEWVDSKDYYYMMAFKVDNCEPLIFDYAEYYHSAMSKSNLHSDGWAELFNRHLIWTSETFPKGTNLGALIHAEREIKEVVSDINSHAPIENLSEEFADVFGCLIDAANRSGVTPDMILQSYTKKLTKNMARKWRDNGDGSYSHIKDSPTK